MLCCRLLLELVSDSRGVPDSELRVFGNGIVFGTCADMILANDACVLRIFGQADTERWLQIWEAATAIWSMCVRGAKGGSVTGLGESFSVISALVLRLGLRDRRSNNGDSLEAETDMMSRGQ